MAVVNLANNLKALNKEQKAIFATLPVPEQEQIIEIPIEKIVSPQIQARTWINVVKVESISKSAKVYGILQPILVVPLDDGTYELVYGKHRIEAIKQLGQEKIKAISKNLTQSERLEIALIENLQREDQNPIDETLGILNLAMLKLDCDESTARVCFNELFYRQTGREKNTRVSTGANMTQEQLSVVETILERFNLTVKTFITHKLPLLECHDEIIQAIREGKIAYSKARVIDRVKPDKFRAKLLNCAINSNLSRELLSKISKIEDIKLAIKLLDQIELENLTPEEIQKQIKENKPVKNDLQKRYSKAILKLNKNQTIWQDKSKQKELEQLITKIEKLTK